MNREEILKQCCTSACTWNDDKACHQITIEDDITLDDIKFLSTVRVYTLNLSANNIGENGAKYLAENKTIHTLDLTFSNIGENGAKYLAENKTIRILNLTFNKIGDTGAKYLAENTTIHTLSLYHNNIGGNGAKYLAENKTIHSLSLSANNIGCNGAKYLADNKYIHTLNLSSNIGDYGAQYFTKSIIPNLILEGKYKNICEISKSNYFEYIKNIQDIVFKYIIKDIANIIVNYIKND